TVNADQQPSFTLVKALVSINGDTELTEYSTVGDVLAYTITVANTGNVTLNNVAISDLLTGFTAMIASLVPDAEEVFVTDYTITQADLDAGSVMNTPTAGGEPPIVTVNANQQPSFTLVKALASINGNTGLTEYSAIDDELAY